MITGKTKVCGLIGDPVDHSLSPCLQNAAFKHYGLDFIYIAFRVKQEDLKDTILGVRSLGFHGLNVTMPHKINVIQYLDDLDATAKRIGSVNTILNRNGKLIGYTTDGIGAQKALKYYGVDPSAKKVVILGAGGASRSVSLTLAKDARELVILNRTLSKAEMLAKELRALYRQDTVIKADELNGQNVKRELADANILVNATPIGMQPNDESTPVDTALLRSDLVVFDLVYEPLETKLLIEAKKRGATTIDGLTMLVFQGAMSFEIWTGRTAPFEVMMKAATSELALRARNKN
ncbi:shikimate dehydrogenase [Candidatus Bathyarchaeota archaeon]|nr:shikimate dehydrogenase [Candidatus Bathyarchaeota archaeon]